MRRPLSLILLAAALLAQTPVACVATGHGTAASGTHESAAGVPAAAAGAHAHHGAHDAQARSDAGRSDDGGAAKQQSPTELPCAAIARCHWSALPQDAVLALDVDGRSVGRVDRAPVRPVEPVSQFPTPPPRRLS